MSEVRGFADLETGLIPRILIGGRIGQIFDVISMKGQRKVGHLDGELGRDIEDPVIIDQDGRGSGGDGDPGVSILNGHLTKTSLCGILKL